jgi:hypothetical protein
MLSLVLPCGVSGNTKVSDTRSGKALTALGSIIV